MSAALDICKHPELESCVDCPSRAAYTDYMGCVTFEMRCLAASWDCYCRGVCRDCSASRNPFHEKDPR